DGGRNQAREHAPDVRGSVCPGIAQSRRDCGVRIPRRGRRFPLKAAQYVQERIHFLGFIREHEFVDGEIPRVGYYFANWHLFGKAEDAAHAYATYPLARVS